MDSLDFAKSKAKAVGEFLWKNFSQYKKITEKFDRSLSTNFDMEAEKIITQAIKEAFPDYGILSEEKVKKEGDDYLWIVDPLDGTHNFIRGIEIFGVSIALAYKGEVMMGVIFLPYKNELYWARKGEGAYLNGERISVSGVKELRRASVSFDSSIRYDVDKILKVLGRVSEKVFNIRMLGSSVRILSFLAQGKLDCAIEFNDLAWDCAAGKILIEEAGGRFTALNGSNWKIEDKGYLASNGLLHQEFLDMINEDIENN